MWILIASFLVHVIFLSAFYDLYLNPIEIFGDGNYTNTLEPATKRFVIFLVDGLNDNNLISLQRSDDEFPILNTSHMEFLRSIGDNNSIWGSAWMPTPKTTLPDPGILGLLTGFSESLQQYLYPNKSIVLDSIFNQSLGTWAWGTVDLLAIIDKIKMRHVHVYPNEPLITKDIDPNFLDTWLTDQVVKFFDNNINNSNLHSEKVTFYVHFPGVGIQQRLRDWDPKKAPINESLKNLDQNIQRIVNKIERFYLDLNTTYLFISSRGEFSRKPDGVGFELNVLMPYLMWGAAVNHTSRNYPNKYVNSYKKRANRRIYELTIVISTMLGITIPKGCKGKFVEMNWNISAKQKAEAFYATLVQQGSELRHLESILVDQYQYPVYSKLKRGVYQYLLHHVNDLIEYREYNDAISESYHLQNLIQNGWTYYRTYHEDFAKILLSTTMLMWIAILLEYVIRPSIARYPLKYAPSCLFTELQCRSIVAGYYVLTYVVITLITYFFYVANLPCIFFLYSCLPLILVCVLLTYFETWVRLVHVFFENDIYVKVKTLIFICSIFMITNYLCLLFMKKILLFFAIVLSSVWLLVIQKKVNLFNGTIQRWILSTILLSWFPVANLFNYKGSFAGFLSISGSFWILMALYILFKYGSNGGFYQDRYLVVILQPWILALAVGLISVIHFCVIPNEYDFYIQRGTWLLIVMALIIPLFGGNSVKTRVEQTFLSLAVPFIFLSTGYEPLFLLIFCFHIYNWMDIECLLVTDRQRGDSGDSNDDVVPKRKIAQFTFDLKVEPKINNKFVNLDDFRRALYCVLFILVGCFTTDNMISERLNDPLLIRTFFSARFAFESNCSRLLYLMKVGIPILVVLIAFRAINIITHASFRRTLYILLAYLTLTAKNIFLIVYEYPTTYYFGIAFIDFLAIEALVLFVIVAYGMSVIYTKFSILDLPMVTSKFKLNTCTL